MKKLLKNILFLLIPVLILICILPVNRRLKYQGLKDDCFNHGIWIHDRIHNNTNPINIAFIGSSHTINGVNDQLISSNLDGIEAVNLGYCRLGRNLSYVLLKELLEEKTPKQIVIEVREDESRHSHPIFPYLAKTRDVFLANPLFNKNIFTDFWTHLVFKIEIIQDQIYKHELPVPIRTDNYGFASSPNIVPTAKLEEILAKKGTPRVELKEFERDFVNAFPRVYLEKISDLCDKKNIQMTFLFLPSYGTSIEKPNEHKTYEKYGTTLIPPKNILDNQLNWSDEGHLNQSGANELSIWLATKLNKNIIQ